MDTQNLATAIRPSRLSGVVGQDNAVAAITGAFKEKRLPSTILLTGGSGCGKTTIAKIIARMFNCEKHTVCGKCFSCQFGDSHPDIIFHNAGTHGKVDDIRALVRGASAAPITKKRVIIIDEVHAITGASESALLVSTESPPKNTVWILCTTNPEKLPSTMVNRCLRLNLKPIEHEVIVSHLLDVATKQGCEKLVKTKDGKNAITMIASISNGSMRDALSHLELLMLALSSGKKFDAAGSITAFVESSETDLDTAAAVFVGALVQRDLTGAVTQIRKVNNARALLSKSRWLVDYFIGARTKTAKFVPYTARIFAKQCPDVKCPLWLSVAIQSALVNLELRMNSCSIDENVLFTAAVGDLLTEIAE